jgi:hypothetical protein
MTGSVRETGGMLNQLELLLNSRPIQVYRAKMISVQKFVQ